MAERILLSLVHGESVDVTVITLNETVLRCATKRNALKIHDRLFDKHRLGCTADCTFAPLLPQCSQIFMKGGALAECHEPLCPTCENCLETIRFLIVVLRQAYTLPSPVTISNTDFTALIQRIQHSATDDAVVKFEEFKQALVANSGVGESARLMLQQTLLCDVLVTS